MFTFIQRNMKWGALLALLLLACACDKTDENAYQPTLAPENVNQPREYLVGIHPLHYPERLMDVYGPIVEYMNVNIPAARFRIEASRNYEEYEIKLYEGHFDFAMPNPYETIRSLKHGYRIFGKMGDDDNFRGIILVRKDSGINEVKDLKGKAVSYPAATALAACMMPQYYLQTHGIDVNRDIENRYVGLQESSILYVLRGQVAAGATWPVPWKIFSAKNPQWANELEVKWQTEPLLNNGWVVRSDVPQPIADAFAKHLFKLQESEQGRMILEKVSVSRFEPATEETYRPVKDFLEKFSRTVRLVEN